MHNRWQTVDRGKEIRWYQHVCRGHACDLGLQVVRAPCRVQLRLLYGQRLCNPMRSAVRLFTHVVRRVRGHRQKAKPRISHPRMRRSSLRRADRGAVGPRAAVAASVAADAAVDAAVAASVAAAADAAVAAAVAAICAAGAASKMRCSGAFPREPPALLPHASRQHFWTPFVYPLPAPPNNRNPKPNPIPNLNPNSTLSLVTRCRGRIWPSHRPTSRTPSTSRATPPWGAVGLMRQPGGQRVPRSTGSAASR